MMRKTSKWRRTRRTRPSASGKLRSRRRKEEEEQKKKKTGVDHC